MSDSLFKNLDNPVNDYLVQPSKPVEEDNATLEEHSSHSAQPLNQDEEHKHENGGIKQADSQNDGESQEQKERHKPQHEAEGDKDHIALKQQIDNGDFFGN